MKRILLISLVSLVLFGCKEKKVTEEMLIGDWRCSGFTHEANWENGTFLEYGETKDKKDGVVKYFLKNDELFWSAESVSYPFHLVSYNDLWVESSDNGKKIKAKKSIKYISNDEFKITLTNEYMFDNKRDNRKIKRDINCERIKE